MKEPKNLTSFLPSSGSKPAPSFEFSVGGRVLPSSGGRLFLEEDESPASLVTLATLRFTPEAEDDGKYAACSATNRYFPGEKKADGYVVSVRCEYGRSCAKVVADCVWLT